MNVIIGLHNVWICLLFGSLRTISYSFVRALRWWFHLIVKCCLTSLLIALVNIKFIKYPVQWYDFVEQTQRPVDSEWNVQRKWVWSHPLIDLMCISYKPLKPNLVRKSPSKKSNDKHAHPYITVMLKTTRNTISH